MKIMDVLFRLVMVVVLVLGWMNFPAGWALLVSFGSSFYILAGLRRMWENDPRLFTPTDFFNVCIDVVAHTIVAWFVWWQIAAIVTFAIVVLSLISLGHRLVTGRWGARRRTT